MDPQAAESIWVHFLTMTLEWAYYVNRGKELRAFAAVVGAYGQYMLLIRYFV